MSLLALALIGFLGQSQDPVSSPTPAPLSTTSNRERTIEVARDIMTAARYASLITLGPENQPQARIVDPTAPDPGLTIYVATNPRSRKVGEIRKDSRVTVLYFDTTRLGFVTLFARATELHGAEKAAHYRPEWERFFDRRAPDTYLLYKIVPDRLEIVSAGDGFSGDPATWTPTVVELR